LQVLIDPPVMPLVYCLMCVAPCGDELTDLWIDEERGTKLPKDASQPREIMSYRQLVRRWTRRMVGVELAVIGLFVLILL
jgi:hypothetical protein